MNDDEWSWQDVRADESGPSGEAPEGPAVREDVPQRLGAYRILRPLGAGGMGAVYLAVREEEYHAEVAVKLLKASADRDLFQRFRGERQILAGLEHPNIARLLDGGTTQQGTPYLVMEFVDGTPIDRYCDEQDLSIAERIGLFQQVCSAVDYAHRNLVVHRDLKPGNILVTAEGVPKLLDFGIAKLLSPEASSAFHQTRTGRTPLTPRYASPEQIRGEPITVASDVYALGVLLYELLVGEAPYDLENTALEGLLLQICQTDPRRPSDACRRQGWRRELSGDLDNIILMALRKEPERRYAGVAALAEDLEHFVSDRPVRATPDSWSYRVGKLMRRHRGSAGAVAVLCLLGGTGLAVWQAGIADRERSLAQERFQQVRQLAHSFLFEFEEAVKDLPGSTPVREMITQRALSYLDKLSDDQSADAGLLIELATAYQKVGDIQGNPFFSNLGRTEDALVSYAKARKVLARLPDNPAAREQLATVLDRIGDVQAVQGESKSALTVQSEALEIREGLRSAEPTNTGRLLDLASSRERLAELLAWNGQGAEALERQRGVAELYCYREAHQIFADLAADDRGAGPVRDLALILSSLGDHFRQLGGDGKAKPGALRQAERWYAESLGLWRELAGRELLRATDQRTMDETGEALEGVRAVQRGL